MRSRRRRNVVVVAGLVVAFGSSLLVPALPASASDPERHDVKVTKDPGVRTFTWTGSVSPVPTGLAGAVVSPCVGDADFEDLHTIDLDLAARVYSSVTVTYDFQITWGNAGDDLALLVTGPEGTVGSSDGGDPVETVQAINLDEGEYTVNVCTFASAGVTEYTGTLKMTTKSKRRPAAATTTSTTVAGAAESGSGATGTASPARSTSTSPPPAAPTVRRPSTSGASSVNASGSLSSLVTEPSPLPPVEAAPPAFISSGIDPLESVAPPPVAVVEKDAKSMPLGLALLVSALGLAGLGLALLVRRRRGLDEVPTTALVPVSS